MEDFLLFLSFLFLFINPELFNNPYFMIVVSSPEKGTLQGGLDLEDLVLTFLDLDLSIDSLSLLLLIELLEFFFVSFDLPLATTKSSRSLGDYISVSNF